MRPGRSIVAAVTATVLLLGVPACGSEPEEGPISAGDPGSSSAEESTSPTSATEQPAPEAPPATDDEQGRKAFAEWFVQALAYGNRTNDAGPITERAIEDPELACSVCESYASYLADRERDGITYQPSTYQVTKVIKTGEQQGVHVYSVVAKEPAGEDVKDDGTVLKRFPARTAQLIEVGIRFHDGDYEISGWKVGKGAQE